MQGKTVVVVIFQCKQRAHSYFTFDLLVLFSEINKNAAVLQDIRQRNVSQHVI